jgi:protein-S-isoprenylcysteine O-methyltransferase Ste14
VTHKVILVELAAFLAVVVGFHARLKLKGLDPFGESPISPLLFKAGKFCMGVSWFSLLFQAAGLNLSLFRVPPTLDAISAFLLLVGAVFSALSLFHLADNSKVGLPREPIKIETTVVYRFSRNPMYLGFYLITLASCLSVPNPVNTCSGLFGIFVHHRVVLAEEHFLLREYGPSYETYMKKVRRYI